jgi:uncharacterized membrane protein YqjE
MGDYPRPGDQPPPEGREPSVGELVGDISEKTSLLVREEIELAKAEVSEKVTKLIRGTVVGIAAGVFLLLFLAMLMHAIAWLLNDLFFEDSFWAGFLIEAGFWLLLAGLAGLLAYRAVSQGAPPTPDLAIEEAKRTKETLTGEEPRETATGMGATAETSQSR